jgi:hypothetical protein
VLPGHEPLKEGPLGSIPQEGEEAPLLPGHEPLKEGPLGWIPQEGEEDPWVGNEVAQLEAKGL